MNTNHLARRAGATALGLLLAAGAASGQSVEIERSRSVTGPGGRTIEREVSIERGPGGARREVEIRRPGGTYRREAAVSRGPGSAQRHLEIERPAASVHRDVRVERGGFQPGPPIAGGFRREVYVEREVAIRRPPRFVPGVGAGFGPGFLAAPFFSMSIMTPPPPPVVVYPEPVYVAPPPPPPVVTYVPPQPFRRPAPAEVVVDPVAESVARLSSRHPNSREEAAQVLGRLGDARAVPALLDRLRSDPAVDVRESAAVALGTIGDPRARGFLERAAVYDKKDRVRRAAAQAAASIPPAAPAGSFDESAPAPEPLPERAPATFDEPLSLDAPPPLPADIPPVPPEPVLPTSWSARRDRP